MSSGTRAYRQLLRAIRTAFQGDFAVLDAAQNNARQSFIALKDVASSPEKLSKALAHAQAVTKILRENVVQGKQVKEDTYKLNIHEHTERGDNAAVKKLDSRVMSFKELKAQRF